MVPPIFVADRLSPMDAALVGPRAPHSLTAHCRTASPASRTSRFPQFLPTAARASADKIGSPSRSLAPFPNPSPLPGSAFGRRSTGSPAGAARGWPVRIEHAGQPWGERLAASPPRPPSSCGLLRSRPFGPVDGRCRDFANCPGGALTPRCTLSRPATRCAAGRPLSRIEAFASDFLKVSWLASAVSLCHSSPSAALRPKASSDMATALANQLTFKNGRIG